jgi:hypothetical protein
VRSLTVSALYQILLGRTVKQNDCVACLREINAYTILAGNLKGKIQLSRTRSKQEDTLKWVLEKGWGGDESTYLAQDRKH